jgi:hypothetical protein
MSVTYDLPFGKNLTGLSGKLFGGWQVNGIATLLTGFPFTPLLGSNRSGDGNTRNPDRPNLNPNFTGPVILGNQTQWFNPAAFLVPNAGTFGNLGRGNYTGPGLAEVDMSVFKNTSLSERFKLQFRAEIFNLLNRANFGTPSATVSFWHQRQCLGGIDHESDHNPRADPDLIETGVLTARTEARRYASRRLGANRRENHGNDTHNQRA